MAGTRYLIVNADDLGLSAETNRGIFQAHEHGIVTSASLMVRQPGAADAIKKSRRFPDLSIGLHVDLSEWTYRNGQWQLVYQVVPPDDLAAVEAEIFRQIELFRQLAQRDPTHLDSHQNVHNDPPLQLVFTRVAQALKLPLRNFNPPVAYCGEFYGRGKADPFPEGISVENLCRIVRSLPRGVTELGCHPGFDAGLSSDYRAERIEEVRTLCDSKIKTELEREGVTLTSYTALPPAPSDQLVVLSNGMHKSGSTLLTNYTIALLANLFPNNGQEALCKAIATGQLIGISHFVGSIDERALNLLRHMAIWEGPVVVKVHCDTSWHLTEALRSGVIKMTFTQRDPRDAILSGIDHCTRSKGALFCEYTSVEKALAPARWSAEMACNWIRSGLAHIVRYTDLVSEPARELARLADYLGLAVAPETLDAIVAEERANRRPGVWQFNRGDLHRYQKEMSMSDQQLCRDQLGDLLDTLGYPH